MSCTISNLQLYVCVVFLWLTCLHSMMCQYGMSESRSATFPIEKARHLLDDSFLESQSPVRNDPHSTSVSNGLSLGGYSTYSTIRQALGLISFSHTPEDCYFLVYCLQVAVKALSGRSCHLEWRGKSQSSFICQAFSVYMLLTKLFNKGQKELLPEQIDL